MRKISFFSVVFLLLTINSLYSQDTAPQVERDDALQARIIKIKRMSEPWRDANVELRLIDNTAYSGRFIALNDGEFQLNFEGSLKVIPFAMVETVTLIRKPQDLMIVGLAAIGVGGLLAAGASLGFEAEGGEVLIAAITGSVIGFTIGWKNFYRDVTISIR